VVDIKELRTQYNVHEVLVLTQLGILNEQITGIRRELSLLQRASFRSKRLKERDNNKIRPY